MNKNIFSTTVKSYQLPREEVSRHLFWFRRGGGQSLFPVKAVTTHSITTTLLEYTQEQMTAVYIKLLIGFIDKLKFCLKKIKVMDFVCGALHPFRHSHKNQLNYHLLMKVLTRPRFMRALVFTSEFSRNLVSPSKNSGISSL